MRDANFRALSIVLAALFLGFIGYWVYQNSFLEEKPGPDRFTEGARRSAEHYKATAPTPFEVQRLIQESKGPIYQPTQNDVLVVPPGEMGPPGAAQPFVVVPRRW